MDKIKLTYDKEITIATAKSSNSKNWQNRSILISELFSNLSNPYRTEETIEEFKNADKDIRNKIKNCKGGFVGGALKQNGPRVKDNLLNRILVTLDIDQCIKPIEEYLKDLDCSYCIYSTHSHREDYKRYRLIIPLDRAVTPAEYEAIARMQASMIDKSMNIFDDTTYQPIRLMYWASIPKDADYYFKYSDSPLLKADDILNEYFLGWDDISLWPRSQREMNKIHDAVKDEQQDPLTKDGIIGAFCKAYTITDAITEFLPNVYGLSDDTRGTYNAGSTTGGLIIYDNKFSYSFHSTDPTSCILCNAFDLVRIHKFGKLDQEIKKGRPSKELPSFKAMIEFANKDEKVIEEVAKNEFGIDEKDYSWFKKLDKTEKGDIKNTITNLRIIMASDSNLKDKFIFNEFSAQIEKSSLDLPWKPRSLEISDHDLAGIKEYIQRVYKIKGNSNYDEALTLTAFDNYSHPVKDYLDSLKWDGELRAERLFIDYLGVEDSKYTRTVTIKMLLAAVTRVFDPGHKFDNMLVLQGVQGIGKSTLLKKLAVKSNWFNDNKVNVEDSKKIMENYSGCLIIEIAELSSFSKKTAEAIKSFISATQYRSRLAFGRASTTYKVQYILFGTTNDDTFLNDKTGNRRFWVLNCNKENIIKNVWNDLDNEIDQIWAEVYQRFKTGEELTLNNELLKVAEEKQEKHLNNELHDIIIDKLNFNVPKDKWIKITPTKLIDILHLSDGEKRMARRDMRAVLSKMGIKQQRNESMRYYLLPPVREDIFLG